PFFGLAPTGAQLGVEDVAAQRDALVAQRDAAPAEQLLDLALVLAAPRAHVGRADPLAGGLDGLQLLRRRYAELAGRVDRQPAAHLLVAVRADHDELPALQGLRADRAVHSARVSLTGVAWHKDREAFAAGWARVIAATGLPYTRGVRVLI